MLFNSLAFTIFLPVVLLLYFRLKHRQQNALLLVASYVFYGWWDVRFLVLLAISTIVDYHCAWQMGQTENEKVRKRLLLVSICTNLGILGFFKYFNFFVESAAPLLNQLGMQADSLTLRIILPVGISFYTFQSLSYTVDVYRRQLQPIRNFWDVALYVSFFPQLVAGPIERAVNLLPQVQTPRVFDAKRFVDGLWLILVGYLKKLVIADRCAALVTGGFVGTSLPGEGLDTWMFVYAFAFQIYGDFAGYTDIARGIARLLGFELMKNFGAPYFVTNPSAFWRHWHISLSTWLRDYLYIPLGGNRGGTVRMYRNLSLTMLLGGLWHGAGWAFVVWGIYHGALLIAHRLMKSLLDAVGKFFPQGPAWMKSYKFLGIVFFFHLTCIGWLIFRIGSFTTGDGVNVDEVGYIIDSLGQMFASVRLTDFDVLRVVLPLGVLAMVLQLAHDANERFHEWSTGLQVFAVVASITLIATLGVFGGTEFIYFQF